MISEKADEYLQLPYHVGWQDLKDLFRQAGMISSFCALKTAASKR